VKTTIRIWYAKINLTISISYFKIYSYRDKESSILLLRLYQHLISFLWAFSQLTSSLHTFVIFKQHWIIIQIYLLHSEVLLS